MRTLRTILAATILVAAAPAVADPPPPGPDFHQPAIVRGDIDREYAASEASNPMQPSEVILFDFNSAALDGADRAQLAGVARWLARHPGARIRVEGHADETGAAAYNQALSLLRALSVREELVNAGVPMARIDILEFGETRPVAQSSWVNRRVRVWGALP